MNKAATSVLHRTTTHIACCIALLICGAGWSLAQAAIESVQFADSTSEQRYQDLIAELRCLVCQNQNLADSNADLAKDLRRKTAEMVNSGQTDEQIIEYMRARYGDFVLYKPPLNSSTIVLWLGPFLLLFIAAVTVLVSVKRRHLKEQNKPTDADAEMLQLKARNVLNQHAGNHQPDTVKDTSQKQAKP